MDSKKLEKLIGDFRDDSASVPGAMNSAGDTAKADVGTNHIASVLSIQDLSNFASNDLTKSGRNQISPPIMHQNPLWRPADHELSSFGVDRTGASNDAVFDEGIFEASNWRRNWPTNRTAVRVHRLRRGVVKRRHCACCHGFVRNSDTVSEPNVVLVSKVVTGVVPCSRLEQCQKTPGWTEPCIGGDVSNGKPQIGLADDLFTGICRTIIAPVERDTLERLVRKAV